MIGRTLAGVAVLAYNAKALHLTSTASDAVKDESSDHSDCDHGPADEAYIRFTAKSSVHLHSVKEFDDNFKNFEVAHASVLEHNADKSSSFKMGHNDLSVMSAGQKAALLGFSTSGQDVTTLAEITAPILAETTQSSWDWRTKGAVNAVVSQGGCGSCWAFAAVAPYEWLVHSVTGKLKKYSEQQITSCYDRFGGCTGGHHYWAWREYTSSKKMALDCKYPYTDGKSGKTSACTMSASKEDKDSVMTKGNVGKAKDVNALKALIAQQVIGIAVNAGCSAFYGYKSGIFDTGCGIALDHAVNLVGYGPDYYILRNSWGTGWGDGGYMKIAAKAGNGVSGCQMNITYPTKA